MTLRLRVPAWVDQVSVRLSIDGKSLTVPRVHKGFVALERRWIDGDRILLEFALPVYLEPLDAQRPNTVAVLRGPLVLFGVGEGPVSRRQLLSLKTTGRMKFKPFTALEDEPYRTYFNVA